MDCQTFDPAGTPESIVIARTKRLILLCNKEKPSSCRGRGRADDARRQRIINVLVHCFPLRGGLGVQAAPRRNGAGLEVDGAVLTSMRWKRGSPGLAEHLPEVKVFRGTSGAELELVVRSGAAACFRQT